MRFPETMCLGATLPRAMCGTPVYSLIGTMTPQLSTHFHCLPGLSREFNVATLVPPYTFNAVRSAGSLTRGSPFWGKNGAGIAEIRP